MLVSCKFYVFFKLTLLLFDCRELVKRVMEENDCGASLRWISIHSRCSLYKFFPMISCSHSSVARITWLMLENCIFKMENFMRNILQS